MKRKLYEFTALLECNLTVAAKDRKTARDAVKDLEKAWIEIGDFVGVAGLSLVDIRDPKTQDEDELDDLAHIII